MEVTRVATGVAEGHAALAAGDWERARSEFEGALTESGGDDPEALDGLGRAFWWLRDSRAAVAHRERAYAGFRRQGELARAARLALWLAREYALVWRNEPAANGWTARAERLLADGAPGAEEGWLALARSERATDGSESAGLAAAALETALRAGDTDLEVRALAQLGSAEVSLGQVDQGLARFDEAMAAATAGEPTLETFADVCCGLMLACDLAGDEERPKQWSRVVDAFLETYDHVPLLAFCRTCCADVHAAAGRIGEAEEELLEAIRELSRAGLRSRCAPPAAKLAAIRVLQGRFAEAQELLEGFEEEPEAVQAAVALRLARGEPRAAAALLERRLAEVERRTPLAATLLAQLVEVRLSSGDHDQAADAAEETAAIAAQTGRERLQAVAALARGRVAAARREEDARPLLEQAVTLFTRLRLTLEAGRARLELARAIAPAEPEAAVDLARRARTELERTGADREADAASALLRELGARGRAGPRSDGLLSKREREVLALLGEGLTNAGIGGRLFISPKTAEHHVGRILAKLELRSRAEAAAYAIRTGRGE
jgi:DNA-binding CsgD family transcriptional regulator